MAEWKTVTIFVVVCCAIHAARASIVSTDVVSAAENADVATFAVDQVILTSADTSDATSDWTLPANVRIGRPIANDLQSRSIDGTMGFDPQASLWTSSTADLASPGGAASSSLRSGDLPVGGDIVAAMPVASVSIPLPAALPATAALLIPLGFFTLLWKKSRHPRD